MNIYCKTPTPNTRKQNQKYHRRMLHHLLALATWSLPEPTGLKCNTPSKSAHTADISNTFESPRFPKLTLLTDWL